MVTVPLKLVNISNMVTVKEASDIIFDHLIEPKMLTVKLGEATGSVLAALVRADRDFPPFDRVAMDGIAINHAEWLKGRRAFQVAGTQAAGEPAKVLSDVRQCMEVMTGAMLPRGCDAVVRYEDVDINDAMATVRTDGVTLHQHLHRQGLDAVKGQALLQPGTKISPSEIAVLASVGKETVEVYNFPPIAIISTGDELVEVGAIPHAHQIRQSNVWALKSALSAMGAEATLFHFKDERAVLEEKLARIADEFEVLILSGGVSKGKFDFVPDALEKAGIRKLFYQVSQRPGKPFWFGASDKGHVAFALPGNPVSTFMCFYKYVKPWIQKCLRLPSAEQVAVLASPVTFSAPLTYFLQVSVRNVGGRLIASPEAGGGSGDFANLAKVTGFMQLPLEKSEFAEGEVYPYIPFRD